MFHSTVAFADPQFNQHFFAILSEYRKTKKFCDIKIRVANETIYAHKVVLSASSLYFERQFLKRNVKEMEFANFETNFATMSAIIDYAYTGRIEIALENLKLLLHNLETFQMSFNLRHQLENTKLTDLNDDNCFGMFFLSEELSLPDLKFIATKYIAVNFKTVSVTDKFKMLDEHQIEKVLGAIRSGTEDAITKFEAILTWVKCDWNIRSKLLESMLNKYISTKNLSSAYVAKFVLKDDQLLRSFDGLKWIFESFLDDYPLNENPLLYAFNDADLFLRRFDIVENVFTEHERPEYEDFGMVKYKNCIYGVGGAVQYKPTDYGWKYHTMAKTWQRFDCNIGKTLCGVCSLQDRLYVIGGCGEDCISDSTCSNYDYQTGILLDICSLRIKREIPGIVVYHSSIYAIAGCPKKEPIERFDPREGKWQNVTEIQLAGPTSSAVIGHTICSLNIADKILQVYDVRKLQFSTLLKIPDAMTIAALNGNFYVGGNFGIQTYDRVNNVLTSCSEYMKCTLLVC